MTAKPKRNLFWPSVDTVDDANWAVRQAMIAAIVVAGLTFIVASLAIAGVAFVKSLGIDGWSMIDAALFGVIAFFLNRKSRVAAWAGLALYVAERVFQFVTVGPKGPVMAVVFVLAFIGGVRGAESLRRLGDTPPGQSVAA
jgi:hypothetical protein